MKKVLWVGSSKRDLDEMPKATVRSFGYGLFQAQMGQRPDIAKTCSGYGSADIVELVEDERGDTFRVVYTIQYEDAVIVLHSFQKKSKRGIERLARRNPGPFRAGSRRAIYSGGSDECRSASLPSGESPSFQEGVLQTPKQDKE